MGQRHTPQGASAPRSGTQTCLVVFGDSRAEIERSEGQVIDLFFIKTCELHYLYVSLQRFVESLNLFIPNWRKIWKDL